MGAKTATFADPAPDRITQRVFLRCLYAGGPVRAHRTRPETGTLLGERLPHPDFKPLLKLDGERLACAGWWVGYVDEQGAWRLAGSGRLVAAQPEGSDRGCWFLEIVLTAVRQARPDHEGCVFVTIPSTVMAADIVEARELLEARGNKVAESSNSDHTWTLYVTGRDAAAAFEGDPWPEGTPWSVRFAGALRIVEATQ